MKTRIARIFTKGLARVALGACLVACAWAGQQTLWWTPSVSQGVNRYEFRFGTNSGSYQITNVISGGSATNGSFTLPAGRWFVVGYALNVSNGVSDASAEVTFDVPAPITIRLNLSGADNLEGPWGIEDTNAIWTVTMERPRRFYRGTVEVVSRP